MRQGSKQPEPEESQGSPAWMVTFCDSMTLMLTFFVLLFSFSSFDEGVFEQLSLPVGKDLSGVSPTVVRDKSAFLPSNRIVPVEYLSDGSEKPTLDRGGEENLKEETESANAHNRKVFLASSDKIFYGKGTAISLQGRKTLSYMASFLKEVPNRVVISENGQVDENFDEYWGLQRAWAVIEYLTTKHNLDKSLFSIAARTLQEDLGRNQQDWSETKSGRMLEIVLLERSIYN